MNVAFYLPNNGCSVDCRDVTMGNPGIGGTEYMIIAVAYYLSKSKFNGSIYLLAQDIRFLPQECYCIEVQGVNDAIDVCLQNKIDCLVMQNSPQTNTIFEKNLEDLKIVFWGHSFMSRWQLNQYARCKNVKRVVCVGNEELELFCDHKAYNKSVVIFNAIPNLIEPSEIVPYAERKNEVTFLASLVPHTNFHLLAKAWGTVVHAVPDAHLNVIGSGNLYNNSTQLGEWGIANQEYEKKFMPFLLDDKGKILPSVTFWGKLGNERYDILKKTKVGVPNPGGYETFCISAIEMQLLGARVVSLKKGGFLDTVYNLNDLYSNTDYLAEHIIKALRDRDYNYDNVYKYIKDNFSFSKICKQWISVFNEIENGVKPLPLCLKSKAPTRTHKFRHINRVIKSILPGGYLLPSGMFYQAVLNRILNLFACSR